MRMLVITAACLAFAFCYAEEARSYVRAGTEKYHLKDFEGAIADYTSAIAADPKYTIAYKFRGICKSMKEDWKGASKI
jgi:hypothetical protein